MDELAAHISHHLSATKYPYADRSGQEGAIADTWRRVASALVAVEPRDAAAWDERFFDVLKDSNSCQAAASKQAQERRATSRSSIAS